MMWEYIWHGGELGTYLRGSVRRRLYAYAEATVPKITVITRKV